MLGGNMLIGRWGVYPICKQNMQSKSVVVLFHLMKLSFHLEDMAGKRSPKTRRFYLRFVS